MGFMSFDPPLSGTIYTKNDLVKAREVWIDAERRCMPGWLTTLHGLLGKLFEAETLFTTCLLIDIARALYVLSRNITQKSTIVFGKKIRSLLTAVDQKQFDELLNELFVAASLAPVVSPIAFEPYVPAGIGKGHLMRWLQKVTKTTGEQLPSSEYAILLPDGIVAIEATVLYVKRLEYWERRVNTIRDLLAKTIGGMEGVFRDIDIELPLDFDPRLGNKLSERAVTSQIVKRERGKLEFSVGKNIAVLKWRPMPKYQGSIFEVRNVPDEVNSWIVTSPGATVKNGFGLKARPTGDPKEFSEAMFRSLKNTLDRKRQQFRKRKDRYVLVLKIGHHRVPSELLHNLFRTCIWPNPSYEWITCFGEFLLARDYSKGSSRHSFKFQINPNGAPIAGHHLEALLGGNKVFHTDKGIIKGSLRTQQTAELVLYRSPMATVKGKFLRAWSTFSLTYSTLTRKRRPNINQASRR
jgi:hypothetical protein